MDAKIPELSLMRQGVNYRFPVKIRNFAVFLRPLTMDETTQSAVEIAAQVQMLAPEVRTDFQQAVIYSRVVLKYASSEFPGSKEFRLSDFVLGGMTPDETNYAYQQYLEGLKKCNPAYDQLPLNAIEALVDSIKKNPSELTGSFLLQELEKLGLVLIDLGPAE